MKCFCNERGIVLVVALIAMVLLSVAAVGLMRSVHTHTLVVGNLAFRQAAQAMAASAVEKAVHDLFPPSSTIDDLNVHAPTRNYYATLQPGQDAAGVPLALQGDLAAYPAEAQVIIDKAAGNSARYIIERLCDDDALGKDPAPHDCETIARRVSPAKEGQLRNGISLPGIPYYRMTVRVDGPANSVAFSQAMLR